MRRTKSDLAHGVSVFVDVPFVPLPILDHVALTPLENILGKDGMEQRVRQQFEHRLEVFSQNVERYILGARIGVRGQRNREVRYLLLDLVVSPGGRAAS